MGENGERTAAIWAEELSLPVEVTRLAYKNLKSGYLETGAPKIKNLKATMQEILDSGAIKSPLDLNKTLDTRFLP